MAVFVGAGFVLLVKAQSNLGKAAGVALALSAPLLTGMKLLSVDKLLSAHSLFSLHYHGRPAQEVAHELAPFSTSVSFPAFPSGTAQPQPALQCAMDTLAAEIARDRDLHLVLVVGRADRQELSLTARGRYATNWGLAQQRGDFFAGVLRSRGLPAAKLIVTTAGPLHTKNAQPNSEWDDDRRVSIFVQGQGSVHSWTEKIGRGGVWSLCDKRLGGGA